MKFEIFILYKCFLKVMRFLIIKLLNKKKKTFSFFLTGRLHPVPQDRGREFYQHHHHHTTSYSFPFTLFHHQHHPPVVFFRCWKKEDRTLRWSCRSSEVTGSRTERLLWEPRHPQTAASVKKKRPMAQSQVEKVEEEEKEEALDTGWRATVQHERTADTFSEEWVEVKFDLNDCHS